MLLRDTDHGLPEPDDGQIRLSLMAGALACAALFGAIYGGVQTLLF